MTDGQKWVMGLMSGMSLDGVDAALIRTDGITVSEFGPALTLAYDDTMHERLRAAVKLEGNMAEASRLLTLKHIEAVQELLHKAGARAQEVAMVGFHGQTVYHAPEKGITWQIGDPALLALRTGIDVVADFRSHDVAAGGQGAPLVPLYHAAIARKLSLPVAVVNLGCIGNVTWIGEDSERDVVAFDSGPGNELIDNWVFRQTGSYYDNGGALALSGAVNASVLDSWLRHPFFDRLPPKSLDRNTFATSELTNAMLEDGAATLSAFTAASIVAASKFFPRPVSRWIICGGGRHNKAIMRELSLRLKEPVVPAENVGWDGDALEAQAFGYLAMRSKRGLPLTLPTTTGVSRAVTGGAFYRAEQGVIP